MVDASKHQRLRLAQEGAVLLVCPQGKPSVAHHREEVSIGTFHSIAGGRQIIILESGDVQSHALAHSAAIYPAIVRGLLLVLRPRSLGGPGLAHSRARMQSVSEGRVSLEVSEHPPELGTTDHHRR